MIRTLLAKVRAEATFLVLLVVAGVGAWLYVDAQRTRADRDDVVHRAEVICAGSGVAFAATAQMKRGQACAAQIAALVRFKADSDQTTARTLAAAMAAHDARQSADAALARAAAEAARDATARMEIENAKVEAQADGTGRVGRDWFAAVNSVAGLRPPR